MVKVPPTLVQDPTALYVTGKPEEAVAVTVKLLPTTALAGAGVVTLMVWFVSREFANSVTCGAAL